MVLTDSTLKWLGVLQQVIPQGGAWNRHHNKPESESGSGSDVLGSWNCDDSLNDSVGNNPMTCPDPEYVEGYSGSAISFDYSKVYTIDASAYNFLSNDYLNFETRFNCISESYDDAIRITFVIPTMDSNGITFLIHRAGFWFFGSDTVGEAFKSFSGTASLPLVGWHKIKIMFQSDVFNIYIDDVLIVENYDLIVNGFVSIVDRTITAIEISEAFIGGG